MLSAGIVLFAIPSLVPVAIRDFLDKQGWGIFNHPPYSPDITPSNYHLFTRLKGFLGGKHFGSDELKNARHSGLAAEEKTRKF